VLLQELQNLVNLLGIPSSLNFAVMGAVILAGVLADQQFNRYRERRRAAQALGVLHEESTAVPPRGEPPNAHRTQ
jgi:ribose transport system permease protein